MQFPYRNTIMESAPSALSELCLLLWLETIPTPQQFTPTVLLKEKRIAREEFR